MKKISIALVGFGTVGRGLIKMLATRNDWLRSNKLQANIQFLSTKRLGFRKAVTPFSCTQFHTETAKLEGEELQSKLQILFPTKLLAKEGLASSSINTVIELTPTYLTLENSSYQTIKLALKNGKNVITANKGPIALHFKQLRQLAAAHQSKLGFESTVLSGTPLFNIIKHSLLGSPIKAFHGILNGTCNFILNKMEEGLPYIDALALAKQLGYAETNPDADVEGFDSLAKLLILTEVIYGKTLSLQSTKCKGISTLTQEDFLAAKNAGKRIKLVATACLNGEEIEAQVQPLHLPPEDPLFFVNGVNNAVCFNVQELGAVKIEGPGAGSLATASGIFSDLLEQNIE